MRTGDGFQGWLPTYRRVAARPLARWASQPPQRNRRQGLSPVHSATRVSATPAFFWSYGAPARWCRSPSALWIWSRDAAGVDDVGGDVVQLAVVMLRHASQ